MVPEYLLEVPGAVAVVVACYSILAFLVAQIEVAEVLAAHQPVVALAVAEVHEVGAAFAVSEVAEVASSYSEACVGLESQATIGILATVE